MQALLPLVGRILLAAIFLWSAIKDIRGFEATAKMMGEKGIPIPSIFLLGAIVFLLLGSIAIILGIKARWGAVLLILFLIPTTVIFHSPNGDEVQFIHFMKNLALIGGLCMVVANGVGPVSFDGPAPAMKK
ncbi:MAG: DoxX family protein [Phycisphaerales bacterium]|nr:DoxX family protein [Phycisphaerales bacterium]